MSKQLQPEQIAPHCLRELEAVGYQVHEKPLRIVDLSFDFDQVLTGPNDHHALVLLVDQPELEIGALNRRLSSLGLALSRTGSRRPVTIVLVTPPLEQSDLEALRQLARLVIIDRVARSVASVDHILREFRPVITTKASAPLVNALDELTEILGSRAEHPQAQRIIRAASKGADAVEQAFRILLDEAIAGPAPPTP